MHKKDYDSRILQKSANVYKVNKVTYHFVFQLIYESIHLTTRVLRSISVYFVQYGFSSRVLRGIQFFPYNFQYIIVFIPVSCTRIKLTGNYNKRIELTVIIPEKLNYLCHPEGIINYNYG